MKKELKMLEKVQKVEEMWLHNSLSDALSESHEEARSTMQF